MRNSFNEKTQKKILSLLSEIAQTDGELPRLKKALAVGLYQTAEPLQKTKLTRESWSHYFPEGTVQSPIETVRMGEHQFEKLQREDRDHLLDGVYRTLTNPSIIFNIITTDKADGKAKPQHIYAKSFYHESFKQDKVIQSVVIFRNSINVAISNHSKDLERIFKFLKDPQALIYMETTLVEKTSLALEQAGCLADLKHINTRPINLAYDEKNLLNEISFTQETKTVGTNPDRVTPLDLTKGGSHAGLMEQSSKDLNTGYTKNGGLSRENPAFTQETKTVGTNPDRVTPLDLTKGGSHARHLETVRNRASAFTNIKYTENGNLSRENPAFAQETKTVGENLRPSDSAAQNEVGSHARHLETVRDRVSALRIKEYTENGGLSRENSAFIQETKTVGTNPDRVTPLDLTKGGSPSRHQETVRDRVSTLRIKEYTENGGLSSGKTVLEKFMEENGIKTAKAEKTNVRGKNQDMEL